MSSSWNAMSQEKEEVQYKNKEESLAPRSDGTTGDGGRLVS